MTTSHSKCCKTEVSSSGKCTQCKELCIEIFPDLKNEAILRDKLSMTKLKECTCASFFTVRGTHKSDCPCFSHINDDLREEWRKFVFTEDNFESFDIRHYEKRIADWWLSHITASNKQLLDELSADVGENYVDNEETFVTPNGEITNKERSRFRSLLQSRRDGLEGKL